jgi:hypothetical protein
VSVRQVRDTAVVIGLLLAAIVLAEAPPFAAAAAWIDARERPLLIAIGAILLLGCALFFGGILKLLIDRGEPLSHADVEDVERSVRMAAQPVAWRASTYRVIGSAAGRQGAESFNLRELKAALRAGAVWRDPEWRRRAVVVAGALLLVIGIFGGGVVVGPPWLKMLLAGALGYAFGRLGWGFTRL